MKKPTAAQSFNAREVEILHLLITHSLRGAPLPSTVARLPEFARLARKVQTMRERTAPDKAQPPALPPPPPHTRRSW